MRIALISAVMLVVSSAGALAQDASTMTSHQRAAAELIDILELENAAAAVGDVMAQALGQQSPISAELIEMIVAFRQEFIRWEDLRPGYIRIYCDAYTEDELKLLIDFYGTPVGRKTLDIAPQIMKQTIELHQKLMQQHLPELQRRIRLRTGPGGL